MLISWRLAFSILLLALVVAVMGLFLYSDGRSVSHAQSLFQADLLLTLHQDPADGATGIVPQVTRVTDPATGNETPTLLGSFQAQLTYDDNCINVLDVRELDFTVTGLNIDNPNGVTTFNGISASGSSVPSSLGHALTRLASSNQQLCAMTVEISALTESTGASLDVLPQTIGISLQRGDARADGTINIADALFIAQYLVGLRTECITVVDTTCLHSVNAAGVRQDGAVDGKSIADALFIAQFLVGLRDELFNRVNVLSRDFTLDLDPSNGTIIPGSTTTYSVSASGTAGFADMITLSVTGLPPGVTGSFSPQIITAEQRSTLTVVADASAGTASSIMRVSGEAVIDATAVKKSAQANLIVEAAGRTGLQGQVLIVDGTPLKGVSLTLGGTTVSTDGGGNFLLLDVPDGQQTITVDATPANPTYPIYGIDVILTAGQITSIPALRITPPPPPQNFIPINNGGGDQVVTDQRFPGFSITLPQGSTIMGWDGVPRDKIAISQLTPDQLPVSQPPGHTNALYQISFGTPMGGLPSAPLPVTLPNDQDLAPGEQAEIWYYDAAPVGGASAGWRFAGLGTTSNDGIMVVSDPGVGIERFCGVCGLVCIIDHQKKEPNLNPLGPKTADPVDLALGQMIVEKTDLVLPGRVPAVVHRTYNPFDAFGNIAGFQLGLGPGWALSVDVVLQEETADLRRIVLPGNARFAFARQSDGTFANKTHPNFAGAVLTVESSGRHRLKFRDGTSWEFASGFLGAIGQIPIPGLGLLVDQVDRNGNRLDIQRDNRGKITRIVESGGRELLFTHSSGLVSQITDPIGRSVQYGYSGGRLQTVTDPAGGVTTYSYDSAGRILDITDPRGIEYLRNEYSPLSGRILKQTQADGGVWEFRYRVYSVIPPPSPCTPSNCIIADPFIPLLEESIATIAAGLTGPLRDKVIQTIVVDPAGNTTTYRWGRANFASSITDALGQTTFFERDSQGQVVAISDPLHRGTRFTYDNQGNVTSITDPEGNIIRFEYEPTFNGLTRLTDQLANVTAVDYDNAGNLVRITDPLGNTSRIDYDAQGQPTAFTDALSNVVTFNYDLLGNLTTIIDPLGNTTRRSFDTLSRLIEQMDPKGRTGQLAYDEFNQLVETVDPLNNRTSFSYDGNGNLLEVTDARGNTTVHTYDVMDRLATRTDPIGNIESFVYDGVGSLVQGTDRNGQVNSFNYDPLNRLDSASYADGSSTSFTYDVVGRLIQATDSTSGTILNQYDLLDRLVLQTAGLGIINYQYDPLSRRTRMEAPGQSPVDYRYDANSRVTRIAQGSQLVDFNYDSLNRRTNLELPNGVSTEYNYDAASRLTELFYKNGAGILGNLSYTYDSVGSRTGVGGSFSRTLLPDPVGSASYDLGNRQEQFRSRDQTFDNNGNLTSITDATGLTTYTWDSRNRLSGISGPNVNASFIYDAFDRRNTKQINGVSTRYLYDGLDMVREEVNGTPVNYLTGLNIDEPLVRNGTEYYLADALGSVVALADGSGNLQTQYTYGPFGKTVVSGASTNTFQYTGRENDGTGLYYYRARYYDPSDGRFIGEDPIKFAGGNINLYAYVRNNPVFLNDPLGLMSFGGLNPLLGGLNPLRPLIRNCLIVVCIYVGSFPGPDSLGGKLPDPLPGVNYPAPVLPETETPRLRPSIEGEPPKEKDEDQSGANNSISPPADTPAPSEGPTYPPTGLGPWGPPGFAPFLPPETAGRKSP